MKKHAKVTYAMKRLQKTEHNLPSCVTFVLLTDHGTHLRWINRG